MNSYLKGFDEIVNLHLIRVFDENELELLMCGIGKIDVKDWKRHTIYKGGYHQSHVVIQYFWRVCLMNKAEQNECKCFTHTLFF
jgi:ubiquitin protein ligase, putative